MIKEILVLYIGIFIISFFVAFILKGKSNIKKWNMYVWDTIPVILYVIFLIYFLKFSTFEIIDNVFYIALIVIFILISVGIFFMFIGIEIGNLLQSKLKKYFRNKL